MATPCFRNRITIKVQLSQFSLIVKIPLQYYQFKRDKRGMQSKTQIKHICEITTLSGCHPHL